MKDLRFDKSFERAFKQRTLRNNVLKEKIYHTLDLLSKDAFQPRLDTHKLRGELEGLWACSVEYDCRVVFTFQKDVSTGNEVIVLVDIGTHDEVY